MTMLKKETLADQAAEVLSRRIISGELPGGMRLTEEMLCRQLGISRTPLRDALRRLDAEGLVEILPHRGCRVTEWSAESIRELFDARSRIEAVMLELSLPEMPAELLEEWRRALIASLEKPEEERRRISRGIDEELHQGIADYCPNRCLADILRRMLKRTAPFRNYRTSVAPAVDELSAERLRLVEAMIAGDPRPARDLLRRHIRAGGDIVD